VSQCRQRIWRWDAPVCGKTGGLADPNETRKPARLKSTTKSSCSAMRRLSRIRTVSAKTISLRRCIKVPCPSQKRLRAVSVPRSLATSASDNHDNGTLVRRRDASLGRVGSALTERPRDEYRFVHDGQSRCSPSPVRPAVRMLEDRPSPSGSVSTLTPSTEWQLPARRQRLRIRCLTYVTREGHEIARPFAPTGNVQCDRHRRNGPRQRQHCATSRSRRAIRRT